MSTVEAPPGRRIPPWERIPVMGGLLQEREARKLLRLVSAALYLRCNTDGFTVIERGKKDKRDTYEETTQVHLVGDKPYTVFFSVRIGVDDAASESVELKAFEDSGSARGLTVCKQSKDGKSKISVEYYNPSGYQNSDGRLIETIDFMKKLIDTNVDRNKTREVFEGKRKEMGGDVRFVKERTTWIDWARYTHTPTRIL